MSIVRFLRTQYRLSLLAGFTPQKARWRAVVSFVKGF